MRRFIFALFILIASPAFAQGPTTTTTITPFPSNMADCTNTTCTPFVAAAPAQPASGGLVQLKAFGWLEPYVDTLVQLIITAVFGILAKSKYSQWLDQSSRDALETFLKNRASSLIAAGAVRMEGKTVDVHSAALASAANEAAKAIPDAMKRFGLTPDVVAAKIVDAIPQTTAGAAMVAEAHKADAPTMTTTTNIADAGTVNVGEPVTTLKMDPATPNTPPQSQTFGKVPPTVS